MAKGFIFLDPLAHVPDPTNPPELLWTAANRPYLAYDGTTDELGLWRVPIFENYSSAPIIRAYLSMDTATTNNAAIRTEWMLTAVGENIETDNFSAVEASADATVPGTATHLFVIEDTLGTPTFAADDFGWLRFGRENGTSGTNATGDMFFWGGIIEYTTT